METRICCRVGPMQSRGQHHAENLADAAPGETVKRRLDRERVQGDVRVVSVVGVVRTASRTQSRGSWKRCERGPARQRPPQKSDPPRPQLYFRRLAQ